MIRRLLVGAVLRQIFRLDLRPDLGPCPFDGCPGRLVAVLSDDGQAWEAVGCTGCGRSAEYTPPREPPQCGERTLFRRHFLAITPPQMPEGSR
jgi:hypothetical protein